MGTEEQQSKTLVVALVMLVLASVFLTYYRSFVARDFMVVRGEPETGEAAAPQSE